MTTLRISITKEVLQATKDCKSNPGRNCAISYAIRQIWPCGHVDGIDIWPFVHNLNYVPPLRNIKIAHWQKPFVYQFDDATPAERAAMQPFSFHIEVPDEVIGEVNIDEIRRICEGSKTLELVKN